MAMENMQKEYNGILVVNKPYGLTSRDVVNRVSKLLSTKKVGHTGTLDPIATGVLILTIGSYTKLSNDITDSFKVYTVTTELGYETDTLDNTGTIVKKSDKKVSEKDILYVINTFIGEYEQEVPVYSAVKINGKKLYEYARKDIKVELPKRNVIIKSISNIEIDKNCFKFTCEVSKGTYIRSLIRDIGRKLGTYATMTSLTRDYQSGFSISAANSIEEIESNRFKIYSVEDVFKDIIIVNCDEKKRKEIINGAIQNIDCDKKYILYKYQNIDLALYKKDNNCYRMHVKFR